MPAKSQLDDRDFFAWSREQAELLRAGKLAEADIEHIAEEIDSMGRTEKRELISRLSVLLHHLLRWRYQPEKRSPSWEASIRVQRTASRSSRRQPEPQAPPAPGGSVARGGLNSARQQSNSKIRRRHGGVEARLRRVPNRRFLLLCPHSSIAVVEHP